MGSKSLNERAWTPPWFFAPCPSGHITADKGKSLISPKLFLATSFYPQAVIPTLS